MSIMCAVSGHRPSETTIRNAGRHFSRCTRCRVDIVEEARGWISAPKGFRIVWKEPEPKPSSANDDVLELGPEHREQRAWIERRLAGGGGLPKFLDGKDRRRVRDRRQGFGKKSGRVAAQP